CAPPVRAHRGRPCGCPLRHPRPECGSSADPRQLNLEERAACRRVGELQVSAVHLDEAAGDMETEPGPGNALRRGKPHESLENPPATGSRAPAAAVGNAKKGGMAVAYRRDANLGSRGGVPGGVLQTVAKGLGQLSRVHLDRELRGGAIDEQRVLRQPVAET